MVLEGRAIMIFRGAGYGEVEVEADTLCFNISARICFILLLIFEDEGGLCMFGWHLLISFKKLSI